MKKNRNMGSSLRLCMYLLVLILGFAWRTLTAQTIPNVQPEIDIQSELDDLKVKKDPIVVTIPGLEPDLVLIAADLERQKYRIKNIGFQSSNINFSSDYQNGTALPAHADLGFRLDVYVSDFPDRFDSQRCRPGIPQCQPLPDWYLNPTREDLDEQASQYSSCVSICASQSGIDYFPCVDNCASKQIYSCYADTCHFSTPKCGIDKKVSDPLADIISQSTQSDQWIDGYLPATQTGYNKPIPELHQQELCASDFAVSEDQLVVDSVQALNTQCPICQTCDCSQVHSILNQTGNSIVLKGICEIVTDCSAGVKLNVANDLASLPLNGELSLRTNATARLSHSGYNGLVKRLPETYTSLLDSAQHAIVEITATSNQDANSTNNRMVIPLSQE